MGKVTLMNDSSLTDDEALRVVARIPIAVLDDVKKDKVRVTHPQNGVNVILRAIGSGDRIYQVFDITKEAS